MTASFLSVLFVLFSGSSFAATYSQQIPYYGEDFYNDLSSGVQNEELVARLQTVLRSQHRVIPGQMDEITDNCNGTKGCYQHISLGYDRARIFLLGVYYLVDEGNGNYGLPDVYCANIRYSNEFRGTPPGPRTIPDSTTLNTEHTWPQSRFTGKFDKGMQKSDLHHLYPADSEMNSVRGNNEFGEVSRDSKVLKCRVSRTGKGTGGGAEIFEPPTGHKGNVARALFYFSVRYSTPISPNQEKVLRKWHLEDPVDEEEMHRNNEIQKTQGNRNPFIDFPELVDYIHNF
ncbi:endonuclease [Bdellovibrio sp. ArHS]|uniref:endonuclease I family protein n=1 Tax=Bdellovibrio sp. ArHS TaxID=1569284 RepID=UPI000AA63389|nr:endonuclease [Bdellovibrio sp. ArHS]